MKGRLLFSADDGIHGNELWTTDGTAAATRLVKDLCPGSCSGDPGRFTDLGGATVFFATDGGAFGLWTTDGTEEGTGRAPDLVPGAFGGPRDSAKLGSKTVFRGSDPEHGTELWITDGTRSGTSLLRDIRPGRDSGLGRDSRLASVGDLVLFAADDGERGFEVWATDGTPEGTLLVADICPGPCSGAAGLQFEGAALGRIFCFFGSTEENYSSREGSTTQFWRTDGTPRGTYAIGPPFKLEFPFITRSMVVAGDQVFFESGSPDDTVLMKSDGTTEATLVSKGPKEPNHLVEWRGSTFFTARDDASPARELWRTDGTEGGTVRLRDVLGVPTGSDPVGLGPYRGMLFYAVAGDPLHGIELWATDGTGAGTGMLGDIRAGSGNGLPRASRQGEIVFGLGDRVYFVGSDGMSGDELWAYRVAKE